ncbi:MAG: hypothetical protein AB7W47_11295 [Calditrichaceae bacterium]
MNSLESYLNERIVLTCLNEISYAGTVNKILMIDDNKGLLLKIDELSGFSVWCPQNFIKDILIIPIPKLD